MSFTSPPEPIGAKAIFTVISNENTKYDLYKLTKISNQSGLTSISVSHLNWDVSSPLINKYHSII